MEKLEYIYFSDTGDKNEDSEMADFDFIIYNFNG